MATIGDAILGAINTNWAVPTGGVKPTLANTEDVRFDYPDVTEIVIALSYTLYTRVERVNDTYVDRFHTITLQAQTTDATDMEERLHEIVDEVDRILNTNGVTGFTTVKMMKKDYTPSDRSRGIYACNMHIELIERNTDSATAAGSTATMDIGALTMYGSSNAAWIPTTYLAVNQPGKIMAWAGYISNIDGTDFYAHFTLPLPTNKGSLKLYVTGCRVIVNDADAGDFVSTVYVNGQDETGQTAILTDATNRTAQGDYEYAIADTDCSSYDYINVTVHAEVTNANDLEFGNPLLECFYYT